MCVNRQLKGISLKRLFTILLILCAWGGDPMAHAQIYTTSSATYPSCSTGGWIDRLPVDQFRTTSLYVQQNDVVQYSTAAMYVANGYVKTVASQLRGGISADEFASQQCITPKRMGLSGGGIAPPAPGQGNTNNQPLTLGWDVILLLLICSTVYALHIYRKRRLTNA